MLVKFLLLCFGCWSLQVSALQCHLINSQAGGTFSNKTRACPGHICAVFLEFVPQNHSLVQYWHDCSEHCLRREWIVLSKNVFNDPDQICTFYIEDGRLRIYCECITNFCNDIASPLHRLARSIFKAASEGKDLYTYLGNLKPPTHNFYKRAIDNTEPNVTIPKAKVAALTALDTAPEPLKCQKVIRSGTSLSIGEEVGKAPACAIRFQTSGDLKTVTQFDHLSLSSCIVRRFVQKVYYVDGFPDQTCVHYIIDNKDSVYCDCATNMCNAINSPLHKLMKSVVKIAHGRDLSSYVNYQF